ncbi:hypothetical protein HC891_13735 [Candidatus Gracilibacteria bacterium]|nr:hypothetical protein [Candidatus Gracilibacteria bacterium]
MRHSNAALLAGLLVLTLWLGGAAAQSDGTRIYLPLIVQERQRGVSTNLEADAATHLGGAQADSGGGVGVTSDGSIVFGGTLPGYETRQVLIAGTGGTLLVFDSSGREVRASFRVGDSINDMETSAEDETVICGHFGVLALDRFFARRWQGDDGEGQRCAIGSGGTVAVLVGGETFVYNRAGTTLGRWSVGGGTANDIAVDATKQQVIVTGFVQVSGNLQIPFIRAFSYDGTLRWKSYDFAAGTPNLGSADTRGERIAIGRDGKLYFAGSINGGTGVSIFTRDPKDTSKSASDRTVVTDKYTDAFNVGSVKMLWYARFNSENGELELAQSLLTRRSGDRGNSIAAAAITADSDGTVYIAGSAAAFIANRDQTSVAGIAPGVYSGSDAYVLVVSPDFTQRYSWVTFTGASGNGGANAVAVRNGRAALAATLNSGAFITHNAIQPLPGGDKDAYLVVWRGGACRIRESAEPKNQRTKEQRAGSKPSTFEVVLSLR